jgi:hypothetical protein
MATPPATEAPTRLVADRLASKAEIDRGEGVPLQPVLDDMQAAINRIRAGQAKTNQA